MTSTLLIVPGLNDSGPEHWQTWLQDEVEGTSRVTDINWEKPVIQDWAVGIRKAIDAIAGPVCLVAHSYGCLGSLVAAAECPERIASALLVAPANPERFTPWGFRNEEKDSDLSALIPSGCLAFPSVVVASDSDSWMDLPTAMRWSDRWGSVLMILQNAGHVNVEAGFGPWPDGLNLVRLLQTAY